MRSISTYQILNSRLSRETNSFSYCEKKEDNPLQELFNFEASFFVLRTPLLPITDFIDWGKGLESYKNLNDKQKLQISIEKDELILRKRLQSIVDKKEVDEAIFIANPSLHENIPHWKLCDTTKKDKKSKKIEKSIINYFCRMTSRSTPFGLFAGISIGFVGKNTKIQLKSKDHYKRHSSLDMQYLSSVIEFIESQEHYRKFLLYYPNTTLYKLGQHFRYIESFHGEQSFSYSLVDFPASKYIKKILNFAKNGKNIASLKQALIEDKISGEETSNFINLLIDNQILVSNLPPPITGEHPSKNIIRRLSSLDKKLHQKLKEANLSLKKVDSKKIGTTVSDYGLIIKSLQELPIKLQPSKVIQTNLHKPVKQCHISNKDIDEIIEAIKALYLLSDKQNEEKSLEYFKKNFIDKYEDQEVPLVHVLDEEAGVGFESSPKTIDNFPWLKNIATPPLETKSIQCNEKNIFLLNKILDATTTNAKSITLYRQELEKFKLHKKNPLPDSFAVFAKLQKNSIWLKKIDSPSGVKLLGRFGYDNSLKKKIIQHIEKEESLEPNCIFAEIIHIPEGRSGNIVYRPTFRKYEIPYLTFSNAKCNAISITDIMVSVRQNRIVLRSKKFNKEIIPRLTSAHKYSNYKNLRTYQFLCFLQKQNLTSFVGWDWGVLKGTMSFLPRITFGKIILSEALWKLDKSEIKSICSYKNKIDCFLHIQELIARRKIPRFVNMIDIDRDSEIPVDFNNPLLINSFIKNIKNQEYVILGEYPNSIDDYNVFGEGKFANEVIIPFVRKEKQEHLGKLKKYALYSPKKCIFFPGSKWLYFKIYTDLTNIDYIVIKIREAVDQVLKSNEVEKWFFVRYRDPNWHLRVRFQADPQFLTQEIIPLINKTLRKLNNENTIHKVEISTYVRETNRYGGNKNIIVAEKIFHFDSEAVVHLLKILQDDIEDLRWLSCMLSIDYFLADANLEIEEKISLLKNIWQHLAREIKFSSYKELNFKYNKHKVRINLFFDGSTKNKKEKAIHQIFKNRSQKIKSTSKQKENHSIKYLLYNLIHMNINRSIRSSHRLEELVICYLSYLHYKDKKYKSKD